MAKPIINEVYRMFGYGRANPYEGKPLTEIKSLAARAFSLLQLHKKEPFMGTGYLNIYGAVEMMAGMEYHHDRFVEICAALSEGKIEDESSLYHEAIAYINRLGQFHYFSVSTFVKEIIKNPPLMISTIEKFQLFRNKHAAHRSIDAPRTGDTEEIADNHALSMTRLANIRMISKTTQCDETGMASQLSAAIFFRKITSDSATEAQHAGQHSSQPDHASESVSLEELLIQRRKLWKDCYATFEMYDSDNEQHLDFTLEMQHPKIMTESYNLIEAIMLRT